MSLIEDNFHSELRTNIEADNFEEFRHDITTNARFHLTKNAAFGDYLSIWLFEQQMSPTGPTWYISSNINS